jgi:hypothetical protein
VFDLVQSGQQADGIEVAETIDISAEIARRQQQLNNLAEVQKELDCCAQERFERESN